ncbi:hypothetical protein HNQ07_000111 [Deinococcus metalli]|uniref:Outer membrane protein beta-barrel domain-containing protein n=1 Tax=Deinococcus metalli TaxID=1141878 RepID=A0A7W8KAG7_9DEIO|nr:hypothetical protein [Deinococcus metalli]MBB5374667.1 hypothetical protein [Deinococcus metalli]GHF34595.1 hypothetical protein GCM10017781_09300 [Deinococcus metalli]
MTLLRTLAFTIAATLSPALAQGVTVWGGVGTQLGGEFILSPTVTLGLSTDVGRLQGVQFGVRGSAGLGVIPVDGGPFPLLEADVLVSGSNGGLNLYGGPSVGTIAGALILVGGVGGVRGSFGNGNWGWFTEGRLRYAFSTTNNGGLVVPSASLGVTYRF